MKRRTFLPTLTALLAAFAPKLAAGAPSASPQRHEARAGKRYHLLEAPLAGFQYHAGEAVWPELAVGAPLDLVREPSNPYDELAVRVDWHGHKLGYVPRHKNEAIAKLLDQGARGEARIVALNPGPNPWERVTFSIGVRF